MALGNKAALLTMCASPLCPWIGRGNVIISGFQVDHQIQFAQPDFSDAHWSATLTVSIAASSKGGLAFPMNFWSENYGLSFGSSGGVTLDQTSVPAGTASDTLHVTANGGGAFQVHETAGPGTRDSGDPLALFTSTMTGRRDLLFQAPASSSTLKLPAGIPWTTNIFVSGDWSKASDGDVEGTHVLLYVDPFRSIQQDFVYQPYDRPNVAVGLQPRLPRERCRSGAKRFREVMKDTPAERLPHLLDEIEDYRGASYGTMCAFMVSADDPYIRLMSARTPGDQSWDAKLTHQPPSLAQAQIVAKTYITLIQFFRDHNVRVMNISWGMEPNEFDEAAEKYGNDSDASRRHQTARAAFEVQMQGLYAAMSSAPSILFVAGSGNSDEDVAEAEIAPQSFHLPNLIKVGAVDPAGIAADFTTFGPSVDVYGIGFQRVPLLGGRMCPTVGTSLAAPSVVNLAGKLFAVNPSLNPAQVIDLISRGASRNEEGLLVINPKRSMELANEPLAN